MICTCPQNSENEGEEQTPKKKKKITRKGQSKLSESDSLDDDLEASHLEDEMSEFQVRMPQQVNKNVMAETPGTT